MMMRRKRRRRRRRRRRRMTMMMNGSVKGCVGGCLCVGGQHAVALEWAIGEGKRLGRREMQMKA
jgi:hypothetical protein